MSTESICRGRIIITIHVYKASCLITVSTCPFDSLMDRRGSIHYNGESYIAIVYRYHSVMGKLLFCFLKAVLIQKSRYCMHISLDLNLSKEGSLASSYINTIIQPCFIQCTFCIIFCYHSTMHCTVFYSPGFLHAHK